MSKSKTVDKLAALETKISAFESKPQGSQEPSFSRLESSFVRLFDALHETDMPPTSQIISAVNDDVLKMKTLMNDWKTLKGSVEMKGILGR
jgi:hypothetical protein